MLNSTLITNIWIEIVKSLIGNTLSSI